MKSMTLRVAEFCSRKSGAISSEVAEHFNISLEEARCTIRTIRKSSMYTVIENKSGRSIRVTVVAINKKARKRVPVVAKNIITGDEYTFESLADAEMRGGFYQASISRCLNGEQSSHAGYYWKRA